MSVALHDVSSIFPPRYRDQVLSFSLKILARRERRTLCRNTKLEHELYNKLIRSRRLQIAKIDTTLVRIRGNGIGNSETNPSKQIL